MRWIPLAIMLATGGLIARPVGPVQAAPNVAAQCTNGPNFQLSADLGYIFTPDANLAAMWSFSDVATNAGTFQYPGPLLCVSVGQAVSVTLTNNLDVPTSIMFPGQDDVMANGQPSEPEIDAGTGAVTSMTKSVAPGAAITYSFTPTHPGTYLYASGTDVDTQREMGLFGAIIVRPTTNVDSIYGGAIDTFTHGREFVQILSEIDPAFHNAIDAGQHPAPESRVSKYFFVNGRAMPDTLSPNDSPFLPAQPYSGLIHIVEGEKAAVRYVNAGYHNYPFHPHGNDTQVVGHDAMPLVGIDGDTGDLSINKFLIDVAPGQTVDATFTWTDVEIYGPSTNPIPAILPQVPGLGLTADTWYSMSPYLGHFDNTQLPIGVSQTSECGEYYHMAHSHALEQSTTYGAAFGGMMTLYRVDPSPAAGRAVCP